MAKCKDQKITTDESNLEFLPIILAISRVAQFYTVLPEIRPGLDKWPTHGHATFKLPEGPVSCWVLGPHPH